MLQIHVADIHDPSHAQSGRSVEGLYKGVTAQPGCMRALWTTSTRISNHLKHVTTLGKKLAKHLNLCSEQTRSLTEHQMHLIPKAPVLRICFLSQPSSLFSASEPPPNITEVPLSSSRIWCRRQNSAPEPARPKHNGKTKQT